MNRLPIWVGSGWVQRMASVLMTTTKSVAVSVRTCSAKGWSRAVGSGPWTAETTSGVEAMVSATARARAMASWSPARWAWTQAPASPAATTRTATSTWSAKVCAATLQRLGENSMNTIVTLVTAADTLGVIHRSGFSTRPTPTEVTVSSTADSAVDATPGSAPKRDRTHLLYVAVIVAMVAGILVGWAFPDVGKSLKPLGTGFVNLIKMMITPIIFCTIVLGIGSVRKAAQVGKVGGLALGYFIVMSTVALGIGLVVGNIVHPGDSLNLTAAVAESGASQVAAKAEGGVDFVLGLIPDTLVSSLTSGSVLQALLIALLVGFALQKMGKQGEPILTGIKHLERLVFRLMAMIMWAAPIGAFGAMAALVGATGIGSLKSLGLLMGAFYATCAIFVFAFLGAILKLVTGMNVFSLMRYLAREFLLILSTSSSESALPRLIAKMEHLGVSRPVVGITVPTGYSFNLDGTAIYLTMASLFIAGALGDPLTIPEQISLLLFMIIASKGAAGVSGAGLATLAGGLQSHRPELLDGVGLIVGIDRFMSEARAVTNFSGNAVATVLVGCWTKTVDKERMEEVLSGREPFNEEDMLDENEHSLTEPGDASDVRAEAKADAERAKELTRA